MTGRDLSDLLHAFADEQAAASVATAPDPALEARTLGARVVRRRLVRAGTASLGAAAACVALAIGVQAAVPDPAPPATPAPAPSESATPTPTPTPTSTPTPPEAAGVTVHPALPPALPLPDGLLASTTRDWSLVTYDADTAAVEGLVVPYLLSPDGVLHEVPTPIALGADDGTGYGRRDTITDWLPGTPLVLLSHAEGGRSEVRVADVLTGEVRSTISAGDGAPPRVRFVGDGTSDVLVSGEGQDAAGARLVTSVERRTADGRTLATAPGYVPFGQSVDGVVDEEGHRVLVADVASGLRVLDLGDLTTTATYAVPTDGAAGCLSAWWVGDDVVLACSAGEDVSTDVWATGPGGPRPLATSVPGSPTSAFGTDRGVVVVDRGTSSGVAVEAVGSVEPLGPVVAELAGARRVQGGAVVARYPHEGVPGGLLRYDSASGELTQAVTGVYPGLFTLTDAD